MMSNSVRWIVVVVVVAIASLAVGISFGKYLEQEGVGFVNAPAYDSGWITPNIGEPTIIEHGLGTTEVFVYFTGEGQGEIGTGGVHQYRYGGDITRIGNAGACWYDLNTNHISLWIYSNDIMWNPIRVRMWKIQEPPT